MKMTEYLFSAMLILVIAATTFATESTLYESTARNLPVTAATPPSTVETPAVPDVIKDPKLVQLVFAKLEQETARANTERTAKEEALKLKDQYVAIADKERQRADLLEQAAANRREESAQLRTSIGFLRQSVDEYKIEVKDLRSENARLRSSRKYYAFAGAVTGAAGGILGCKAFR